MNGEIMNFTLSGQTLVFLYACLLGIGLSLYLDVFCVIRLFCGNRKTVTLVCDLLYFLSSAVIVYLFFVCFSYGQVRFYCLVGTLLGFIACRFSVSALIVRFFSWIVRYVHRLIRAIKRPFAAYGQKLVEKKKKRKEKREEKPKKDKKIRQNCLQPVRDVVYNLFKIHRKRSKKEDASLHEAASKTENT